MIIQWIIGLALTGYGFAAMDENADEHIFQLMCAPLGLLWLAELGGLLS